MKKQILIRSFLICALLLVFCFPALADPLVLRDDLSGEVVVPLDQEGNGSRTYSYSYRYPQADETDPSAALINQFYSYKVSDAVDFEIPMMADYYASAETAGDVFVRITYEVTCNNDDFFSVLVRTEGNDFLTYNGHTFSRKDIKPGSSVALPYLLEILESDESDTWLQDRQTARADELVRSLVWANLEKNREKLGIYEDYSKDLFEVSFYPEEDFYLDENGDPVFYLEPGAAADISRGLLIFPISLWEIEDEM